MVGVRNRGETIRQFIINNIEAHAGAIVALAADKFNISRQAVNIRVTCAVGMALS